MFEDKECPGYWDTRILQNQENCESITRFKPLKLVILDQKMAKNALEYPKVPFFSYGSCKQMYTDPFGKVTCKTIEFRPCEY